jgi:hypothetical protein
LLERVLEPLDGGTTLAKFLSQVWTWNVNEDLINK